MNELERKIRRIAPQLRGKTIYAFGNINNLAMVQSALTPYRLQIQLVLDNDQNKAGRSGMFQICLPEEALTPLRADVAILIYAPIHWEEMYDQVRRLGYGENRIFVLNSQFSGTSNYGRLFAACRKAAFGRRVYRDIVGKRRGDFEILIFRGATGDVYLNGLFLLDYQAQHPETALLIAGDAKGLKKVLNIFGFPANQIFPLGEDETSALLLYGIFSGLEQTHIKNTFLWHHTLYFNRCRMRLSYRFNFMDSYRCMIYPGCAKGIIPAPDFRPSTDVAALFRTHGLIPGKTVVIAPVAYSVQRLPIWFWRELTEGLREKGYDICANLSAEEARDYPFVTPVFIPLDSCVALLETAGTFVALRSGFCDIVSSANCQKIILYPSQKPKVVDSIHRCDLAFSGLNRMGLCQDAIELESEAIDDPPLRVDYAPEFDREKELRELLCRVLSCVKPVSE